MKKFIVPDTNYVAVCDVMRLLLPIGSKEHNLVRMICAQITPKLVNRAGARIIDLALRLQALQPRIRKVAVERVTGLGFAVGHFQPPHRLHYSIVTVSKTDGTVRLVVCSSDQTFILHSLQALAVHHPTTLVQVMGNEPVYARDLFKRKAVVYGGWGY